VQWLRWVAECMEQPDLLAALRQFFELIPCDESCGARFVDGRGAVVELGFVAHASLAAGGAVGPTTVLQHGETLLVWVGPPRPSVLEAVTLLFKHYTRIESVSDMDYLTGISNRRALDQSTSRVLSRFARTPQPWALVMLDLVGFKKVNDTLGHTEGDQRLRRAARALVGCIRRGDMAARLGGDEFGLLLSDVREENLPILRERCAVQVRDACGMEFYWGSALISPSHPAPATASDWLKAAAEALVRDRRE